MDEQTLNDSKNAIASLMKSKQHVEREGDHLIHQMVESRILYVEIRGNIQMFRVLLV